MLRSRPRAVAGSTQPLSPLPAIVHSVLAIVRPGLHIVLLAAPVLMLALASAAFAGEPATVTVRVQGLNGQTLLPQTEVTTNTTPIPVESGFCSGTSAGGALFDAVHGNWKAKDDGSAGIELDGIDGLNFPSFAEHGDAYWAFWLNNKFAENGQCAEEVSNGADIVFSAQCVALGPDCPSSATAPDHFLTATAPSSRTPNVGEAVSLTVASISTSSIAPESLPAGVTVSAGSSTFGPSAQGVVTVSFATAGTYTLQAHAPDSVPSDPFTICVHNGNDGTCGTSASPSTPNSPTAPATGGTLSFLAGSLYKGPFAVVARITGLLEHHRYPRAHAPRLLTGTVTAHTAVTSVRISLRRRHGRRCFAYSAVRERFARARCGTAPFFGVATSRSFSYLLPAPLPPGRYVLDVEASDAAGNQTTLARGSSRIVFYVS